MPVINLNIKRAWWYHDEPHRIHYIKVDPHGVERHLFVDEGVPLHALLKAMLDERGYTGPRSKVEQATLT